MKKVIVSLIMLVVSSVAYADTYLGVYGVATNTLDNSAGNYKNVLLNSVAGQSTNGKNGVGYEISFSNSGLGGAVNVFTTVSNFRISLGSILIPDSVKREPVKSWPVAYSNKSGNGVYIDISKEVKDNMYINFRYVKYDVNHNFTSSKCTSNCNESNAVYTVKSGAGYAKREQILLGVTFHM